MKSRFLPALTLTPEVCAAIKTGVLELRTGQWVRDTNGRRGQFITMRDGVCYVSWVRGSETFDARTQRFARVVWHRRRKAKGPVAAILGAPRSMRPGEVQKWVARRFAGIETAPPWDAPRLPDRRPGKPAAAPSGRRMP